VEDLLAERGLDVSYETVRRWVLKFGATNADHAKAAKVKNIYAELGSLARMMRTDPARYSVLIGNLLDGFGADHILWGTDTP
jgi:hypothetical protein